MFGTKNMRFNQKELAFIATRTDIPFDKEGILWLKEKEGHFWQRNEGNCLPDDCVFSLCSIYEPIKIWKIFYDFSNYPHIVTVGVMLSSCFFL